MTFSQKSAPSDEQLAREEMVRLGASFFARGYATGSAGNLSLLLPDGTLLATPTGSCLGELQAERLSKVSLAGEWISGDKPSKEISFHRALYLNNPQCKAVVHLHCTYLTALSCLQGIDPQNVIKPFTPYVVMRVGEIPLVHYYRPGDERLARDLAALAPRYRAFLLANHGPVVTGSSLRAAADNTEEMEDAAKLIFTLGDRPIRYLTDDEIAELRS
ncbi:aldolase [Gibbsiella quercinecans]|uniref:3-oxo-tetronate 4-phosphate decarboxylase n=1 Tax=Gibbsiella quercinecans TaxID=929813 RepID=UPI000EF1422B|nr:aldolase [Gibbsiella quercinecans]RLM11896.1 aldolase [Gibbsiella quercinecans]